MCHQGVLSYLCREAIRLAFASWIASLWDCVLCAFTCAAAGLMCDSFISPLPRGAHGYLRSLSGIFLTYVPIKTSPVKPPNG